MMLAKVWALAALSKSFSFNSSNSASAVFSWLKILMTLWPLMCSSTKPVTLAKFVCWRTKYFPLFPPIFLVTMNMRMIMATARMVSSGLNTIMAIKVTVMVKEDMSTWGMDWLIICRRVSVSLV